MPKYQVVLVDATIVPVTADNVTIPAGGYYVFYNETSGGDQVTAAIFPEADVRLITSEGPSR